MVTWAEFASSAPDLAAQVHRTFATGRHAVMATLRRDGAPRVSGTEVDLEHALGPVLGMSSGAVRAGDLGRDDRVALHSPSIDPPAGDPSAWGGDGKIAGRAVLLPEPQAAGIVAFRVDVGEVVWTGIGPGGDHLLIRSWTPARGLRVDRRD